MIAPNDDPSFAPLESQLRRLRPAELSSYVVDRIVAGIQSPPVPFADRCLLAAMGAGALAAGFIAWALVASALQTPAAPPPRSTASDAAVPQQETLAQMESDLGYGVMGLRGYGGSRDAATSTP